MTNEIFIDGDENTTQLRVQGTETQTEPLQTWENHAGDVLAQITSDGRLELGDQDLATQDALIEANNDIDLDASSESQRGIQSTGIIRRAVGAISDAIAWSVHELELLGSGGVSGLHAALRSQITQKNTGDANLADVRAGDFEANNEAGNSSNRVGRLTGVQSTVTNEATGHLDEAVGVGIRINDAGTDPIQKAYGLFVGDMPLGEEETYAIYTKTGPVHLGDFLELVTPTAMPDQPSPDNVRVYPKDDGKLYAQDWNGKEYDLSWAKHNPNADHNPTGSDDEGDGYSVGSMWFNLTTDKAFICLDALVGAAVWRDITGSGVVDHGVLTGLTDDDHTQYLLTSGARSMVGSLNVGANSLTNAGRLELNEVVAPGTPSVNKISVYAKSDGKVYAKNDTGKEYDLSWAKHKPDASVNPTVNDDYEDGYSVGSMWFNLVNDKAFICLSATVGSAVWRDITSSGENWNADLCPAQPGGLDDEFNDGIISNEWVYVNSSEWEESSNSITIEDEPNVVPAERNLRMLLKEVDTNDFTAIIKARINAEDSDISVGIVEAGIILYEDTSPNRCKLYGITILNNSNSYNTGTHAWDNPHSGGQVYINHHSLTENEWVYIRLRRSGSAYVMDWSSDGLAWSIDDYLTNPDFIPTHIGIGASNSTNGTFPLLIAEFEYFRYRDVCDPISAPAYGAPDTMLKSVYDSDNDGIVSSAVNADTVDNMHAADLVTKALFGENSIIKADVAGAPESLSIDPQTLVGRLTGEITGLTVAQVRTLLGLDTYLAIYETDVARNVPTATNTILNFEDSVAPSGYVTTGSGWNYSVPVPGCYVVMAMITYSNSADFAPSNIVQLRVNGTGISSRVMIRDTGHPASNHAVSVAGSTIVPAMEAGYTIYVEAYQNSGVTQSLDGSPSRNYICIFKLPG